MINHASDSFTGQCVLTTGPSGFYGTYQVAVWDIVAGTYISQTAVQSTVTLGASVWITLSITSQASVSSSATFIQIYLIVSAPSSGTLSGSISLEAIELTSNW